MGVTRQSPAGSPGVGSVRAPDDQELTAAAELRITLVATCPPGAAPADSPDSAR